VENSEEIAKKLDILDAICEQNNIKTDILLVGGAGLVVALEMVDSKFRPTYDLDVQLISSNNMTELRKILQVLEIDEVSGIIDFPPREDFLEGENFELEAGFTSIRVFVPSLELLACTKLFSSREKDLIDLLSCDILARCDKEKLCGLVKEYISYHPYPTNPNLNINQLDGRLDSGDYI